jgi:hypothetical protein
MLIDFSDLNLQYLVMARDLVRRNPEVGAALLGVPDELARLLADLSPQALSHVTCVRPPLLVPRNDFGWWSRLLRALHEGHKGEIEAVLEHASLMMASQEKRRA